MVAKILELRVIDTKVSLPVHPQAKGNVSITDSHNVRHLFARPVPDIPSPHDNVVTFATSYLTEVAEMAALYGGALVDEAELDGYSIIHPNKKR